MKPLVIFFVTQPATANSFLSPHFQKIKDIADIHLISDLKACSYRPLTTLGVPTSHIPVKRNIALISDFIVLARLIHYFHKRRPTVIHTMTPKAGLLGHIAGAVINVPIRLHCFTGQVWVTKRNPLRFFLKVFDLLISRLSTAVLVDSPSQRLFLIQQRLIEPDRSFCLASGSVSGVDVRRFSPSLTARRKLRTQLSVRDNTFVFLFLGRLNRDKGVLDLAKAFAHISRTKQNSELWIVGPDESDMCKQIQVIANQFNCTIRLFDTSESPEVYMQAADLFCLPSLREGFGTTVIEAAACGLPSLVSRIYGLTDAVVEGTTGFMHTPGDISDLAAKMLFCCSNPTELHRLSSRARSYAVESFSQDIVTEALLDFYVRTLS